MNTDEFEQQLARQPLRQPPAHWREEILNASVSSVTPPPVTVADGIITGWRQWFQKLPLAWGAVAVVWVGIVGINALLFSPTKTTASSPATLAAQSPISVWSWQRAQTAFMANGQLEFPEDAPEPQKPVRVNRPRSDRRAGDGLGEILSENFWIWSV
jgi:hypothetical protein